MKNDTASKRTPLEKYLATKEIPYFRSEPFKLVQTFTREEAKEGLNPDIIKFVDQDINKDNFENYSKFLHNFKMSYDEIFAGLQDPDDKEGFKNRVRKVLVETTEIPNYIYLEPVKDLIAQIDKEYNLYKNGPKSVPNEFTSFIHNVLDKEAFALDLKNTFNTERGANLRIMIDVLNAENIIPLVDGQLKSFHTSMGTYFNRNIASYESFRKAENYGKIAKDKIVKKLNPLINRYKL